MYVETRYGNIRLTHHAADRWVERTGRSLEEFIEAVVTSHRPTKRELRNIMKRTPHWQPQRILECSCAYLILKKNNVVTVYDKPMELIMQNELARPFVSVHPRSAIIRETEMAETLMEHDGTAFPDSTFEDGYIAALKFVLNEQGSNVREEFEDLMEKGVQA